MEAMQVSEYARALYRTHGPKAEAEVARKMHECREAGRIEEAEDWSAIRRVISGLRGPSQT
ncbi:hypothetical protein [Albibacillus kandeliae]|uniref:hypothetical protein n=1 Tax=Albibacillus kandeliae TaxID=2174228 RepID=UPI000D697533|nr:hypothetical protein [Albibacillus kandeliae]